jgi:hypothetical protein
MKGFLMKTVTCFTLACAAALSLAACGKSDKASEEATAENVEMPAEEAMSGVDASAAPAADAAAAPGGASDAAAAPAAGASAAAEKATADAEKKM